MSDISVLTEGPYFIKVVQILITVRGKQGESVDFICIPRKGTSNRMRVVKLAMHSILIRSASRIFITRP